MTVPDDREIAALWSEYKLHPTFAVRNALMEHYLPLVYKSAERLRARLPACVEVDDLVSISQLHASIIARLKARFGTSQREMEAIAA